MSRSHDCETCYEEERERLTEIVAALKMLVVAAWTYYIGAGRVLGHCKICEYGPMIVNTTGSALCPKCKHDLMGGGMRIVIAPVVPNE